MESVKKKNVFDKTNIREFHSIHRLFLYLVKNVKNFGVFLKMEWGGGGFHFDCIPPPKVFFEKTLIFLTVLTSPPKKLKISNLNLSKTFFFFDRSCQKHLTEKKHHIKNLKFKGETQKRF